MRRGGKALVLALVLAAASEVRAQDEAEEEDEAVDSKAQAGDDSRAQAGDDSRAQAGDDAGVRYQGVAPGEGAPGRKPRHGRNPLVTWLGFQPQPGGAARVFVQLDREVRHTEEIQDGALVISLAGARMAHANTGRFLDTRFFATAVERVAIEKASRRPGTRRRPGGTRRPPAGSLELVVRFKNPADAHEVPAAMSTGKDGFTYLIVDVPGGSARPNQ